MNMIDKIPPATQTKINKAHLVERLGKVLPSSSLLHKREELKPFECDGMTAYRKVPLVTALPETEEQIIDILKREKITTISSLFYNPELTLKKGIYTKIKPNSDDKADINKAISILNNLNRYNFSQGTVVRNKRLIATEGRGGTQILLKKIKNKKYKNNGVLVKFPKKKQDLRIDLPAVGLNTLKQCKAAGLKGIVLKSKQNIFLERKRCINFANENKMFILSK